MGHGVLCVSFVSCEGPSPRADGSKFWEERWRGSSAAASVQEPEAREVAPRDKLAGRRRQAAQDDPLHPGAVLRGQGRQEREGEKGQPRQGRSRAAPAEVARRGGPKGRGALRHRLLRDACLPLRPRLHRPEGVHRQHLRLHGRRLPLVREAPPGHRARQDPVGHVTARQIQEFERDMVQDGYGGNTVSHTHVLLKTAFIRARKLGDIPSTPSTSSTRPRGLRSR